MINWNAIKELKVEGDYFVFIDSEGKEAHLDRDAVIIAVSSYKVNQ